MSRKSDEKPFHIFVLFSYFHSVICLAAAYTLSVARWHVNLINLFPVQSNFSSVSVSHTSGEVMARVVRHYRSALKREESVETVTKHRAPFSSYSVVVVPSHLRPKLSTSTTRSLHVLLGFSLNVSFPCLPAVYTFGYGFSLIFPSTEDLFFTAATTLRTRANS